MATVFADNCWTIHHYLLLADSGYLGISQSFSYTLEELPRGCPIVSGHFPAVYPFSSTQHFPAAIGKNAAISIPFL
jgi:hypothetical protein